MNTNIELSRKTVLGIFLILFSVLPAASQWTNFVNGIQWIDNNGDPVQAQGGNYLQYEGKWYLVGQDYSYWNAGVNLYSSDDLQTWVFERKIIPPSSYASDRFIERPKLLHCPATGKFVVWCHYEGDQYAASEAAVFYSETIDGLYTFHWGGGPLGIKSRDCNVFVDEDGSAYFISTTSENTDLGLFSLSDDYLSIESHTLLMDNKYREAPAIVKIDDTYFMITSGLTGWAPNQAKISHSTSISSGWSVLTNIGDGIAYDTQAASILTIEGSEKTTYLYVGDRWKDPDLSDSKTVIFPIEFEGTSCKFSYSREFDLDFTTGQTRESSRDYISKSKWSIQYVDSEASCCLSSYAIDGDVNSIWHTEYVGTTPGHPHEMQVDMGEEYEVSGFVCVPRTDGSNNGIIRNYQLFFSDDGANWGSPVSSGWMSYDTEIRINSVRARYFRLVSYSEFDGENFASIAEIDLFGELRSRLESCEALNFRVYPNPAKDMVWIESNEVLERIEVFNISGKKVKDVDCSDLYKTKIDFDRTNEDHLFFLRVHTSTGVYVDRVVVGKI